MVGTPEDFTAYPWSTHHMAANLSRRIPPDATEKPKKGTFGDKNLQWTDNYMSEEAARSSA